MLIVNKKNELQLVSIVGTDTYSFCFAIFVTVDLKQKLVAYNVSTYGASDLKFAQW